MLTRLATDVGHLNAMIQPQCNELSIIKRLLHRPYVEVEKAVLSIICIICHSLKIVTGLCHLQ